ncbi:MAG: hypothetical protein ISN26_05070 [Betaproteobacteria bacterium AqS2]|uniref:Tetratricopeptide repeat protein n=1 Tax=Candidatus Amphirhobacter heronislandensis TaxID=1732024 RepID=A0A930UFF8_9GAMM|nr:hypothetical protein [Betaproteobacteria bacterium AqS2]
MNWERFRRAETAYWAAGVFFLLLLAASIYSDIRLPSATPQPEEMPEELTAIEEGYRSSGDHVEAGRLAREYIEREPKVAAAYRLLAEISYIQGDIIVAAENMEIAAALDPENDDFAFFKSDIYRQIGWFDQGIDVMTVLLDRDPNNVDALLQRADMYLSSGRPQQGLNDLSYALVVSEDKKAEILFRRAHFFASVGQFEDAAVDLEEIPATGDQQWIEAAENLKAQIGL